jgi:hypothetical protein
VEVLLRTSQTATTRFGACASSQGDPAHRRGHRGVGDHGRATHPSVGATGTHHREPSQLVNELVEAADELILNKTIARYGRFDLLCVDELDYLELDKRGADLLFQVLSDREETASAQLRRDYALLV